MIRPSGMQEDEEPSTGQRGEESCNRGDPRRTKLSDTRPPSLWRFAALTTPAHLLPLHYDDAAESAQTRCTTIAIPLRRIVGIRRMLPVNFTPLLHFSRLHLRR